MAVKSNGVKNNAVLSSVAQIKREKEKKSNENFLMNLEESENSHGDLTYGSYIVISIENEKERREKLKKNKYNPDYRYKAEYRKFYTKYRISDSVKAQKMSEDNYDSNCVFRIIPSSQFSLLNKILEIVEDEIIPQNFELDYENFMSEMQDSVDTQDDLMGKPIKYGAKFQLIQESSKRFLCMHETHNDRVKKIFNSNYVDSYCFDLGFSEYPSRLTHFLFEECSNFQREGSGNIKDDHYLNLCAIHNSRKLKAYNSDKHLVMTQSYSTPLYYNLVRESDTFNEVEDVQTSEIVLVAYSNEDYYLNVPHTFDPKDGEYHEENLSFQNTKDYNAWFMVEYNEEKEIVHLKHFNTGKYVSIENGNGMHDLARLVEEKYEENVEESSIVFEPINSDNTNVTLFTNETVFKIRASDKGIDDEDNYLRFANEEDKEAVGNEEINQNIFDDSDLTTVPLVVRDADPINKYDTFKLIFPTDDTYRELVF